MKILKYILASLVIVFITSCSVDNAKSNGYGTLNLKLSDAPMHYDQFMEANITVDKIEIGNTLDQNSMIVIFDKPMKFNLLELVNGFTETLVNTDIPVGNYNLIRSYISSTEMVLKNGDTFTYDMNQNNSMGNGMMQNGMMFNNELGSVDINLDHDLTVSDGSNDEFLMDIDVDHSFMLEGVNFLDYGNGMMMNMSGFSFNPVMRFINMSTAGTIFGKVSSDNGGLADATVALLQLGKIYTTTHTDEEGNYKLLGIPEGLYSLQVEKEGYTMYLTGNEGNMNEINITHDSIVSEDVSMIAIN